MHPCAKAGLFATPRCSGRAIKAVHEAGADFKLEKAQEVANGVAH